jgi:hypothetical protein
MKEIKPFLFINNISCVVLREAHRLCIYYIEKNLTFKNKQPNKTSV